MVSARELACQERILNIQIIDHLTEIAARGLHLRHGYSSLFAYAVKELGFSEGAAHYRIQAKKLCADYPEVKQQLEEGTLTLTGAGQLQSAFERHARRQRQRAREERRRESSGVSAAGGAGGVSGLGGPDGAGAAGETTVAAEGAEAGTGATGAGGAAAATGDAEAPGTAGAAETPLSESVKRELIEQAQGKTTRQISELIAAVVRQANWHMTEGGSPLKRRNNRSTFLREPCVGTREGAGEASVAVRAGGLLSVANDMVWSAEVFTAAEGNTG